MDKPQKHTIQYYDYHEVSRYLEQKYGYSERDFAGMFTYQRNLMKMVDEKFGDESWKHVAPAVANEQQTAAIAYHQELKQSIPEPPYQDFWHFVLSRTEIHNGGMFTMSDIWFDGVSELEDWQKQILEYYLSEFGEDNGYDEREILFKVSW